MPKAKHSTKHDQQPAIMLYVDDWLESSDLKLVSMAAQGLWIHFICRMWKSPKRGCLLKANGKQPQAEEIGKWTGLPEAEVKQLVSELQDEEVCSTMEDGTIYCRRMLRSVKQTLNKSQAGKLGGMASAQAKKSSRLSSKTSPPISNSNSNSTLPAPADAGRGVWDELQEKIGKRRLDYIRTTYSDSRILPAWEWTKTQAAIGKMIGSYNACLCWAIENDKGLKLAAALAPHKTTRRCPFCKYGETADGYGCIRCDGHGMLKAVTDEAYQAMREEAAGGYLGKYGTLPSESSSPPEIPDEDDAPDSRQLKNPPNPPNPPALPDLV